LPEAIARARVCRRGGARTAAATGQRPGPDRTDRAQAGRATDFNYNELPAAALMFQTAPSASRLARFDIAAIEECLQQTQAVFAVINDRLKVHRDRLDDEVVANLVSGYAYVDELIRDERRNPFALGSLHELLELNRLVLCGPLRERRELYAEHLRATDRHFYDEREGGVRDLVEWLEDHRRDSVWERAAGAYIRVLSKPQLFLEGNHRTGTLIMSYLLGREGLPPFVLTPDNAAPYFDPSALITNTQKKSLTMLFRMPSMKKHFAAFLKEQSNPAFLVS
jgi:prophage maintenance system killer protein